MSRPRLISPAHASAAAPASFEGPEAPGALLRGATALLNPPQEGIDINVRDGLPDPQAWTLSSLPFLFSEDEPLKTAMAAMVLLAILAGHATASPWEEDLAQRRAAACSDQPQQASARPIFEVLPIDAASTDRDIALFALPYSDLISYVRPPDRRQSDPPGFARGPDGAILLAALDPGAMAFATLAGLQVATFIHCSAPAIVIVFDATDPGDPRDLLVGFMRQTLGGWSPFSLRFVDAVSIAFPTYHISIVGHSSGGALASYAAGARNLPSITFNASRTIAATTNDGSKQLNVIVLGDPIADPNALSLRPIRGPRALSGINLWLDVEVERPLLQLHDMSTIMTGLGQLL